MYQAPIVLLILECIVPVRPLSSLQLQAIQDGLSVVDTFDACADTIAVLGSNRSMPAVGFGTCCRSAAIGPPLITSTKIYIQNGGRLIDTAQAYDNHVDLGNAIKESHVDRSELWITSKVNVYNTLTTENVSRAVDQSLAELQLNYLDLMLLHGGEGFNIAPDRNVELWKGLIKAKKDGKVRNIGVSNQNQAEIEHLFEQTDELPAVNQIEYHPWVSNETKDLVHWLKSKNIVVTAYGSLGGSHNKAQGSTVEEIAKEHGVTNAQVLLRWALNKGAAVIPGATSTEHIQEDLNCTNFDLNDADVKLLESSAQPEDFMRWKNCKQGCFFPTS